MFLLADTQGANVLIRWGHGWLGITGWGWVLITWGGALAYLFWSDE